MNKENQCLVCIKWNDKLNGRMCFIPNGNDLKCYCSNFIKMTMPNEFVNKEARLLRKKSGYRKKCSMIKNELEKIYER